MQEVVMLVSEDELELPLMVADSVRELAQRLEISETNIYSAINHAKKKGYRCKYVRVRIR